MAQIKEFKALRFTEKAGEIGKLCCPPYDIISEEQKKAFLAVNEHNIIKLELPEQSEAGYNTAKETLNAWISDGLLKTDDTESLYIYEEKFSVGGKDYSFRGFVCYVKLAEFSEGVVLPHEETLSKAKTDRFNLLNSTGCSFSQIYSLYSDENGETAKSIAKLSKDAPIHSFTDADGVTHSLWIAEKSEETVKIAEQFKNRRLYIADGHHRYETALNFRRYCRENGVSNENSEYVMMFLIDMENDGLVVFPTHRMVRNLENFSDAELLKKCEQYFSVEKIESADMGVLEREYNANEKAFIFCSKSGYYLLKLKDISVMDKMFPDSSEALRRLDVTVLHSLVLERILGIDKENMAKQINLTYTRDATEAEEAVKNGTANCSFLLNPTRISEIAAVAAASEKMPQKSTYFYPKLITGLVMNKIK